MAFADYKSMEDVLWKEPVIILNEAFLPERVTRDLPDWFLQDTTFALSIKSSQENEAFYEEFFIVPFLKEIWKHHLWIEKIGCEIFYNYHGLPVSGIPVGGSDIALTRLYWDIRRG